MIKRIVSLLLVLIMCIGLAPTVFADDAQSKSRQIQINFGGYLHSASVELGDDGQIYAPLKWLTYYGGMVYNEENGIRTYYKPDQAENRNYAKRVLIDTNHMQYAVGLYLSPSLFARLVARARDITLWESKILITVGDVLDAFSENILNKYFSQRNTEVKRIYNDYMPLFTGTFSNVEQRNGEMWVPLSELLTLMDMTCAVGDDNRYLCIDPAQETFTDILYEYNNIISDLLFDSSKVVGNKIMEHGGRVISTIFGEIYNISPKEGRKKDYEEIFTSYLLENEVYLSTFNATSNTKVTYFRDVANTFSDVETIFGSAAKCAKPLYDILLEDATNPQFYRDYFKPVSAVTTGLDAISTGLEYANAYANQVEDHRHMLLAVYGYNADSSWPSTSSAVKVNITYNSKASTAIAAVGKFCDNLISEPVSEKIYQKALGSWYYAIKLTEVFCKDEVEYVKNSSKINLMSNVVQYSYDVYRDRLYDYRKSNCDDVNDIRLCLMMALVGSRNAYSIFENDHEGVMDAIDEILIKLYKSGEWKNTNTTSDYESKLTQYKNQLSKLQMQENDAAAMAEIGILTTYLPTYNVASLDWYIYDADNDGYDEVYIDYLDSSKPSAGATPTPIYIHQRIDAHKNTAESKYENKFNNSYTDSIPNPTPDPQVVFGDTSALLSELDAHFANRSGFVSSLACDLNEDGAQDRVYVLHGAANRWNTNANKPAVAFSDNGLSIVAAQATDDGIELRFYYKNDVECPGTTLSYEDSTLTVGTYGFTYNEADTVFEFIGSVRLSSVADYMTNTSRLHSHTDAVKTFPYDYDYNIVDINIDLDGIYDAVTARYEGQNQLIYSLYIKHVQTAIEIYDGVTTNNTAREIIEKLSVVSHDYVEVPQKDKVSAIWGLYEIYMDPNNIAYYGEFLWKLPNGELVTVMMYLPENSLDSVPISLEFYANTFSQDTSTWD